MGSRLPTFYSRYNVLQLLQVRHATVSWSFTHLHILHTELHINRLGNKKTASTGDNYSTLDLFYTQFWVWVGSTRTRTIQGLQTSLHLHLFPAPPAYYQPGAGGASSWTHAATVGPGEVNTVHIQLQRGDYVLMHCASIGLLCFWGTKKSFIYWSWWIFKRLPNVSMARTPTLKYMFIIDSVFFARWIAHRFIWVTQKGL